MLVVDAILGDESEPRFAGRRREAASVRSGDAAKRRLRLVTEEGTDVAVDLPRGTYLRHGAVLADDGERIVVVDRRPEEALVVRLDVSLPATELVRQAIRLGHAFGNLHVPVEIEDVQVRVPITTSPRIALDTVAALGLTGAEATVEVVRLGKDAPIGPAGQAHGHLHG